MITKLRKRLITSERPAYQIAAEIGIHPSTISQYALGRISITPAHLVKLCRYYRCQPEDIDGYLDEDDIVQWVEDSSKDVLEGTA